MKYDNALGYLEELEQAVALDWFGILCFYSEHYYTGSDIEIEQWQQIINLLLDIKVSEKTPVPSAHKFDVQVLDDGRRSHTLDYLGNFKNFSKLTSSLTLDFSCRITIVFGPNGSGKSSLCKAIKVLSESKGPNSPLENVHHKSKEPISFDFRFSSHDSTMNWNEKIGLGKFSDNIKYFDSQIALENVQSTPDANKVVEVSPFKLEVFDFLNENLEEVRKKLNKMIAEVQDKIELQANELITVFSANGFKNNQLFANLKEDKSSAEFLKFVNSYKSLDEIELKKFSDIETKINDLEKKLTPEGQKQLKVQYDLIVKIGKIIKTLQSRLVTLSIDKFDDKLKKLASLRNDQVNEVTSLVPNNKKIEEFKEFLKKSKDVLDYENEKFDNCIFCKQELAPESVDIIRQYYKFLKSDIEKQIQKLEADVNEHTQIKENIKKFDFNDAFTPFADELEEIKQSLLKKTSQIKSYCDDSILNLKDDEKKQLLPWEGLVDSEVKFIETKEQLETQKLKDLSNDIEAKSKELTTLKSERDSITFRKMYEENIDKITVLKVLIEHKQLLNKKSNEANFSQLKRKITDKAKEANADLVVGDFKKKISIQYKDLAEKNIEDSGFVLKNMTGKGQEKVDLSASVQGHPMHRVYSEGEQKVYSLALFFAEAYFEKKSIIVFDDPVSSLDYNYVGNFCIKLKNFIRDNPTKQIIIFTHDWYFLKDFQDQLHRNKFEEKKDYAVYVLENCNNVVINVEKFNDLKRSIDAILRGTDPLTTKEREDLCTYLRRLTEVIINLKVFNDQRTQFKRDKLNPSMFFEYTKVVPLTNEEASKFSDLYSKFSPFLHDNPTEFFQNSDRDVFKTRYADLLALEQALSKKLEVA